MARAGDPSIDHRAHAWDLYQRGYTKANIARELGVSPGTVIRWIASIEQVGGDPDQCIATPRGPRPRLTTSQLLTLQALLQGQGDSLELDDVQWPKPRIAELIQQEFGVSYNPNYIQKVLRRMREAVIQDHAAKSYFTSPHITLYCGDAHQVLATLPGTSIDCIVTSPPYYGQRDYGVPDQLGLEKHPQEYIDRLVAVFMEARRVLKGTGSLWVNLGDTYWSGKGQAGGTDLKQKHRRFLRPQDRTGPPPLCIPKQLLLIPHRFAIAMQDAGWIVRNDNVWHKMNPTPEPVIDRCASAHEYMFHFVLERKYYFNYEAVAVSSQGNSKTKSPPSVWQLRSAPTFKKHIAVFPEALVRLPILATLPPGGTLLDPFCGSGTALGYAVGQGKERRAIGIDISESAIAEARELLMDV